MSIRDEIKRSVENQQLVLLQPTLPGSSMKRFIFAVLEIMTLLYFAVPEIMTLLYGAWTGREQEIRWKRVCADLEWFIEGRLIVVGDDGYMKPLDPAEDEVWEIRCVDPDPSIRIFGRFSETDVFIALGHRCREELEEKGSVEWAAAIRACKADWRKLLLTYPPHSGTSIHDYSSENVVYL